MLQVLVQKDVHRFIIVLPIYLLTCQASEKDLWIFFLGYVLAYASCTTKSGCLVLHVKNA